MGQGDLHECGWLGKLGCLAVGQGRGLPLGLLAGGDPSPSHASPFSPATPIPDPPLHRSLSSLSRNSTPCTPLKHEEVELRGRVKCITDQHGYAIYFSRGVIPHNKKGEVKAFPAPFQDKPYNLHLGLQCYTRYFLKIYGGLPATPLMVSQVRPAAAQ